MNSDVTGKIFCIVRASSDNSYIIVDRGQVLLLGNVAFFGEIGRVEKISTGEGAVSSEQYSIIRSVSDYEFLIVLTAEIQTEDGHLYFPELGNVAVVSSGSSRNELIPMARQLSSNCCVVLGNSSSAGSYVTPPREPQRMEVLTPPGRKNKKNLKRVKRVLNFTSEVLSPVETDTSYNLFLCMDNNTIQLRIDRVAHKGTYVGKMCTVADKKFAYLTVMASGRHTCDFKSAPNSCYGCYEEDTQKQNDIEIKLECCTAPCSLTGNIIGEKHKSQFFVFNCVSRVSETNDLRHCCYFCKKRVTDVTHHLKNVHKGEEQVQEILQNPPYSKERITAFARLRNMGDRLLDDGVALNDRLPVRKPSATPISTYVKCPNCLGLYARLNFSRHERFCNDRPSNRKRVLPIEEIAMTESSVNNALQKVLARLQDDETAHIIYSDAALLAFARHYAVGAMFSDVKGKNVRMQLRLLAKLLVIARNIDPNIVHFKEILTPENHDLVLTAVRMIIGMDIDEKTIAKPSLALLLSSCLTNVANFYKNSILHDLQDAETVKAIDNFLTCHKGSFTEQVSKPSYKIRATQRALSCKVVPSSQNVHCLVAHLDTKLQKSYELLRNGPFNHTVWLTLGKCALVSIMIFNRRRIGEMCQMNLDLYNKKEKVSDEDKEHMTRLEKALANHFTVVKLIAKRVRQVTVLLNDRHLRYVDLFVSLRREAGVPETNRYLFGVPNKNMYIDASQALRQLSIECGASRPETLRATLFRKQIATLSQMIQLSDNEIQQLADSLGHNVDVHKRYYRVPHLVQEATIMSRFFMAVNDNNIERFRGKTIQELEVDIENENADEDEDCLPPTIDLPDMEDMEDPENSNQEQLRIVLSPEKQHNSIRNMNLLEYNDLKARTSPGKVPPSSTLEHMYRCSPPKKTRRVPWTPDELKILNKTLRVHIDLRRIPKNFKSICDSLFAENRDIFLQKRTRQHVYSFLQYRIKQKLPQ